jgi:hypothetical protein
MQMDAVISLIIVSDQLFEFQNLIQRTGAGGFIAAAQ